MSDSIFMVFRHQSPETEKPLSDLGLHKSCAAETHRKPGALTDQRTVHTHTHTYTHIHTEISPSPTFPPSDGILSTLLLYCGV